VKNFVLVSILGSC